VDLNQTNSPFALHEGAIMSRRLLSFTRAGRILLVFALFAQLLSSAAAFTNGQPASLVLGQPNFTSGALPMTSTGTNYPTDVAVDPTSGKLFIADRSNNRVLRFASGAALANGAAAEGVLGQPNFTSNAVATTASGMFFPHGVAVDSAGRLWVADFENNRVLRFDNAAGKPNGAAADGVLGQPDFTSNAVATTASGMRFPHSVTADSAGHLWVEDTNNNRVLRFDDAAGKPNGAAADGVLGQPDFTSSSPATTQSGMSFPTGVVVDNAGRLWVADSGSSRVLRFDGAASKPNGAPADGVLGQADFTSNTFATTASRMWGPSGVAVDSAGRLWVADSGNRVLRFDGAAGKPNGAPADGVLGQPDFTSNVAATTQSGMFFPYGVAVDSAGRLWVADNFNSRVLRFDGAAAKANGAAADGVLGQADFTSHTHPATPNAMSFPHSVAVDPTSSNVFVADGSSNRVLRFASGAALASGAPADGVLGQPNFTSNAQATTQSGMSAPAVVAVDSAGRLWVADTGNHRVLRFDSAAGKPNGAAADGVLGQPDFTSNTFATTQSGMGLPIGVAVDSTGRLWIADLDNSRVLRFDDAAGKPNGAAANGVLGQPDFTSNAQATTQSGLHFPNGVAVDNVGRLWVADSGSSRVLRFDGAAGKPNGAAADGVLGQAGFTSNLFAATASGMKFPSGVAVDSTGRLWVADSSHNRVLRFDGAAGKVNGAAADGVLGQPDFTSNAAATTASGMSFPTGVAVDSAGRLWVADQNNNRVLRFNDLVPRAYLPLIVR
jgi:sugar lactone lactonase YvrE